MLRKSIPTIAILLLVISSVNTVSQNHNRPTNANVIYSQRRVPLVTGSFVVEPGSFNSSKFTVSSRGVLVEGRFRAQGGSRNDIEVYILDEDGYENYRNGHSTPTYYNSGRVTVGRINVHLGEGVYYIIFNNKFSSVSNKAVTANIDLAY